MFAGATQPAPCGFFLACGVLKLNDTPPVGATQPAPCGFFLACRGCVLHKAFTVSERVAIAEAVAERLGKRQGGDRKTDQSGNISTLIDHGKTRDLAAAKAGLGSGKTLEAAM